MEYVLTGTLLGIGYLIQKNKANNKSSSDLDSMYNSSISSLANTEENNKAKAHVYKTINNTENSRKLNLNEKMITTEAGITIPKSKFTHSNMKPFYGTNITQNVGKYSNSTLLETYTGRGMHLPDKNVTPLFCKQSLFKESKTIPPPVEKM